MTLANRVGVHLPNSDDYHKEHLLLLTNDHTGLFSKLPICASSRGTWRSLPYPNPNPNPKTFIR